MAEKRWTQSEVAELVKLTGMGKTIMEIAAMLDRSYDSVRFKQREMKAGNSPAETTPVAPEDDPKRVAFWKRQYSTLESEVKRLRDVHELDELLVERIVDVAPKSYPTPKLCVMRRKTGGTPQSAVLCFSDSHIGKVTTRGQTLGLGEYNFELFLRRLCHMENSIASILHDHTTTDVPEIHVAMIGDMIDGRLAHNAEVSALNTVFDQFYSAGHAIAQFFTRMSALAPLKIHTAVGNHPRFLDQKRVPCKNRYSNLDHFTYALVEALTKDNKRITWNLDKQPFAVFEVQGHVFHAGHGDHLSGGDKALGVPNHAIGRQVSCTAQTFARNKQSIPHYYLLGHLHRAIELSHAMGKVIVNGGFPGVDEFGTVAQFTPAYPCQKFFLMHPKFGQTASYDLRLDLGDDVPHTYELPDNFRCV